MKVSRGSLSRSKVISRTSTRVTRRSPSKAVRRGLRTIASRFMGLWIPDGTSRIRFLALLRRNLLAFLASLRQTDSDRLLAAGHLLAAAPALQPAALHLMHLAFDVLACGRTVLSRTRLLRGLLRRCFFAVDFLAAAFLLGLFLLVLFLADDFFADFLLAFFVAITILPIYLRRQNAFCELHPSG